MRGVILKIKDTKVDTWRKWCEEIDSVYRNEALETLREEQSEQELFAIFNIGGVWYTLGMSEGLSYPSNINRELNKVHKQKKEECLESTPVSHLDILYHLKLKS